MRSSFDDDYFYHYERELAELELARRCGGHTGSRHAELASLHRARRETLIFVEKLATAATQHISGIDRTDKEC